VVAHLSITPRLDPVTGEHCSKTDGIENIYQWRRGTLEVPAILQPVRAKSPMELFAILCEGNQMIAGGVPVATCYRDELLNTLIKFAKSKTAKPTDSGADNTFHVSFAGKVLMRLLYENVMHSMLTVRVDSGQIQVSVRDIDALQPLFQRKVHEFSFLDDGFGYVIIDPPVVFRWQMYDEADSDGSRKQFLHADGRASVTVGSYAETDRMGRVIRTTRANPDSAKQLFQPARNTGGRRDPRK
jgi:hypothetical protein